MQIKKINMNLFRKKTLHQLNVDTSENLLKVLTVKDLTFFGIAAIVGAGIFSTIGTCVSQGGAAVVFLFIFTAISCGISALCYAQFASVITVSGSAYTYAYVAFGELIAWIIGWDLFMEYVISNIAVAISWSGYFVSFFRSIGIIIPTQISFLGNYYKIDMPAFFITSIITWICMVGIKESRNVNNFFIWLKLGVILIFLGVGVFYINPENWSPFAPNGLQGVLYGISSVFFAYIGFDAISTTSEECVNAKRDLPKAMLYSLLISTIIYVLITLVITGMEHYSNLVVSDPMSYVFLKKGFNFMGGGIALFSFIFLTSVMIVYQLGMPRIWMNMSRDGLLPKIFSSIHPKYKTPYFSTILMGLCVGIPALFADLKEVVDLTSIGTLFAFAIICAGIWLSSPKGILQKESTFKVPYFSSIWGFSGVFLLLLYFHYTDIYVIDFNHLQFTQYIFWISFTFIISLSIYKKLSFIPAIGIIFNLYLMSELEAKNWVRFGIWLLIGIGIYLFYGRYKSKLAEKI
jgi:amino acid transporter